MVNDRVKFKKKKKKITVEVHASVWLYALIKR